MSNNVLIGLLLYVVLAVIAMCITGIICDYLFPTLCIVDSTRTDIDTDSTPAIMLALIFTSIIVLFAWWLIAMEDAITTYTRYHDRK